MTSVRRRAIIAFIVVSAVCLVGIALVGGVEAQVEQNETADDDDRDEILFQLETATIQSVEFDDGQAHIYVYMDLPGTIAVQDMSQVGVMSGGEIRVETYSLSGGEHRITVDLVDNRQKIAVLQGSQGQQIDRGVFFGILEGSPTVTLIQTAAAGGASGIFVALLISVRKIRREHETKYKEIFSGQKIRINEKDLDDWRDRVAAKAKHHWLPLTIGIILVLWLLAAWLGVVQSPTEAWGSMGDPGRVLLISSFAALIVGYLPTKQVAYKLWAPAKEFVVELDATGVFDEAADSGFGDFSLQDDLDDIVNELRDKDALKQIEVWAGSPENVSEMRCDAGAVEITTKGGRGHLVKEFDPESNVAKGTWTGMADDMELVLAASMCHYNQSVAQDYMMLLKKIIGALPSLKTQSNLDAVISMDAAFREESGVDPGPMNGFLNSAAEGTVFEGYWSSSDGGDSSDDEEETDKSAEDVSMDIQDEQSQDGDDDE